MAQLLPLGGAYIKIGMWRVVVNREGEYCATLLCIGGPPARRPRRNLTTRIVEFEGMTELPRSAYSNWATKVRVLATKEGWIPHQVDLFNWITGFLAWYDSMENSRETSID